MKRGQVFNVDREYLKLTRMSSKTTLQIYVVVAVLATLISDLHLAAHANLAFPVESDLQTRPRLPDNPVRVQSSDYISRTQRPSSEISGDPDDVTDWSYHYSSQTSAGPGQWHELYPKCGLRYQSPIDIYRTGANVISRRISPLTLTSIDGSRGTRVTIKNSGITVSLKPVNFKTKIQGGGMSGTFTLTNIHFHWAKTDREGSEHKLEGKSYPLEMHLVGVNDRYGSKSKAAEAGDGLLVVALLFEVTQMENSGLGTFIDKLERVRSPGLEVDGGHLNTSLLLPHKSAAFYKYRGSTTSPPCTDNVNWFVYSALQPVSFDQMAQFRRLALGSKVLPQGGNIRPTQPVRKRRIYASNPSLS